MGQGPAEEEANRSRGLWLAALVAWATLIFIASSIPNPPDAGGGDWKYELAHVFEYAVFGGLAFQVSRSWRPGWPTAVCLGAAWAVAVLYGVSDEFHQAFVPNRDASVLDIGFDAIGSAIGVALGWLATRRNRPERGGF